MRTLRPGFLALALILSVASSPMATSLAMAICCPTTDEVCPVRQSCCGKESAANADDPARNAMPACPATQSDCPLLQNAPIEPARTRVAEEPALDAHALAVLVPAAGADGAPPDGLAAAASMLTHGSPRSPSIPAYLSLRHLLL